VNGGYKNNRLLFWESHDTLKHIFVFLGAQYLNVNTGTPVSLWDVMLS